MSSDASSILTSFYPNFFFFSNRQHLIKLCQDEEVLRNKYYTDLELIAQKIRSIPLTTEVSQNLLLGPIKIHSVQKITQKSLINLFSVDFVAKIQTNFWNFFIEFWRQNKL